MFVSQTQQDEARKRQVKSFSAGHQMVSCNNQVFVMPEVHMTAKRSTRRRLLSMGVATGSLLILPRHLLAKSGTPPPGETITHGVIGVGGMGRGHLRMINSDPMARLLAICDVDRRHLARGLKEAGKGVTGYTDFRKLLDRGDIDVVHIVTPPHWHALMSIAAMDSGHDVFCEKPMTRTIGEGKVVINAVRRNGSMFRINTWFRLHGGLYGMGCSAKPLKKLVAAGKLGWPLTVRVSAHTGFDWKLRYWCGKTDLDVQTPPAHFDYDSWLGPAPAKPYHPHRTHNSFRGYWDYDGGGLADMGQHYLDPVQYILGKDHTSPITCQAKAPWPVHPDAVRKWGRVELTYADGCRIILESGEYGCNETRGKPYIEGPLGSIYPGFRTDPPELKELIPTLPEPEPMISDFNIAVKTRRKFGLNEVNGHRSNILVHLANAAIRTGRELTFDPITCTFPGDREANRLVDQPMRAPWHL